MTVPKERRTIVDLFRVSVTSRPQAIAVQEGPVSLTYAELDRLSNRVANRLLRKGLKKEEVVAILLDRSRSFIVSALGVLKAGGTYQPIDIESPDQRVAYLLKDGGSRFVLAQPNQLNRCDGDGSRPIRVDAEWSEFTNESEVDPLVPSDPSSRAYITYTSGSTGLPKGVQIEHGGLTNLIGWYHRFFGMTAQDRVTLTANISFDVSVGDLWPTLAAGATVLVPDHRLFAELEVDRVISWLDKSRATISFMPPALMPLLMERQWPQSIALRYLLTGGDTLRCRPKAWMPFKVINGYGPTENTVWSTFSTVSPEGGAFPPIGRPIGNVSAYVLDEQREAVGVGIPGELYLGGEQVAMGYLNRQELTEEKFPPDPFSQRVGARMYRTGDWVHWQEDGELAFLGRRDDQIQIKGVRIELGEVETALMSHESVIQSCCRPLSREGDVVGITAHLVVSEEASKNELIRDIKQHLMGILPERVVPSHFIIHESFPMTPQGKLDKAALDLGVMQEANARRDAAESTSAPYDVLTAIWKAHLPPSEDISREDCNFFDIGGNSLMAASLLVEVERATGRTIPLSIFRFDPTIGGLRKAVKGHSSDENKEFVVFNDGGSKPPIFFIYHLSGDVNAYHDLANEMGNDQPIYGFLSPALHDQSKMPRSLEGAASYIVGVMGKLDFEGSPTVVGYSWSGLLAYEVGRQWRLLGNKDPLICLVGTEAPLHSVSRFYRIKHLIIWISSFWKDTENRAKRLTGILRRTLNGHIFKMKKPNIEEWHSASLAIIPHLDLGNRYRPNLETPLKIELFREYQDYSDKAHPLHSYSASHESDAGWTKWTGIPPNITWIDAGHLDIIKYPSVKKLAAAIRSAMDRHYA